MNSLESCFLFYADFITSSICQTLKGLVPYNVIFGPFFVCIKSVKIYLKYNISFLNYGVSNVIHNILVVQNCKKSNVKPVSITKK